MIILVIYVYRSKSARVTTFKVTVDAEAGSERGTEGVSSRTADS